MRHLGILGVVLVATVVTVATPVRTLLVRFVSKHLAYANYRLVNNPTGAALYSVWGTVGPVILPEVGRSKRRLTFEPIRSLNYSPSQIPGVIAWWTTLALGVRAIFRSPVRAWGIALLLWIGWNLIFHNVWGDEFFLYSPHWAWALPIIFYFGLSTMGRYQKIIIAALVITAQLIGWANLVQAALERAPHATSQLPRVEFFLFGMGLREKYLYRDGLIIRIHDREVIHKWDKKSHEILPAEYTVRITTTDGRQVHIREDERAVWVETHGNDPASLPGTEVPVRLPRFEGHPHATTLRILHHEVLINVTRHGPVPNLFVYPKPWYRDAALMALVLKETKNVDHIRDWILSLRDPYDFNNKVAEPDNLGQALFLISLVSDRNHPLVPLVLEEAERRAVRQNGTKYLQGLTDGELHPVYQTKWLKFGLQALQLPDDWTIPRVYDSYSALFWMDFKDFYVRGADAADRVKYPYLAWACAHFHGKEPGPLASGPYPLTWEADASQAAYEGMDIVSPEFRARRLAAPHAWHAAEAFLYLLKLQNSDRTSR